MSWIKHLFIFSIFLGLSLSPTEIYTINTRRSYYPSPIAPLFENKFSYQIDKVVNNLFSLLDINRYLFAGHPRENDVRR